MHVICPQNQPRHGYVIYDSTVREAAENRLQMTLALLREAGIEADGEVMDPDPYAAVMDALGEADYDEIIISTHPETRSGWLREGLVDRVGAPRAGRSSTWWWTSTPSATTSSARSWWPTRPWPARRCSTCCAARPRRSRAASS